MKAKNKPRIALTMGDPAGIGPEIVVRAAAASQIAKLADITIYGSEDVISHASAKFANGKNFKIINTCDIKFDDLAIGKIDAEAGIAAYRSIEKATLDTLEGLHDAIVTAPVCKASINKAGINFTGHTEMIAELCGTANFAMMQSAGKLRIAFVTTHIPLAEVPKVLSSQRIIDTAMLLRDAIISEGLKNPRIAIAGLNPHAGENGFMGKEEKEIIEPAIRTLQDMGLQVQGPFPPDTLFIKNTLKCFDGIVSLYHDQGHIPFKMLAFDKGVNSTLGLPIIRTSVDHGTAFEIAWKGIANIGSMLAAIKLAVKRA
ncbi:MAG: 4-hydroxythreonine-4-phosphate dehydrogenase PdxA, partial [Candidatus Nanoarchaeia archaeon]